MIELDGSQGEGGGQILRTSLALSVATGQPVAIEKIRAGRVKPGLMRQHLACVNAAARISGAQVEGAELGSQSLRFVPGPVRAGDYRFAIASAGSCMLVLQTVLPPLLLADAPSHLHLSGGTHNPMAPPFHFLERAFAPLVRRLGADLQLVLRRCGFYPAGGGEVEATIVPAAAGLRPFDLATRGALLSGHAECLAPGLARHVATRELETLGKAMGWSGEQLRTGTARQNEGPGNALLATLAYEQVTEVFTAFGEKSLSAEQVAHGLVKELREFQNSQAAVGPHLADQLALLQGLAAWRSGRGGTFTCSEVTEHTRTNCAVIERFLPVRYAITQAPGAATVKVAPA
ncbi:RNA 3'-terminal phosphate cyclase RtcA [Variovorax paradoxus B4]|uniref:RNA 3'-terminal phosphate cyclase n=2 Tax=Variovorax paradoxus TaxID=34073 RepID=A0A0H2LX56_VARPD|nr:RNA 3'-terminal phosphate cyclase [Variovorax paradoxus]AGU51659.1 RNA 3'-terminal phosphate cyclase RtcA [Variovorax paradoxus B4]KLN54823.1 RNA 3'-terminal phosphate cyclase [Variovorax paradoxus]